MAHAHLRAAPGRLSGYLFVALAVAATSASQVVQAIAARRLPAGGSLLAMLREPRVWLAYVLLAVGLACWLLGLVWLDISRTYPLFALGFVAVLLWARFGFGEGLPPRVWLGAALIVAGGVVSNAA